MLTVNLSKEYLSQIPIAVVSKNIEQDLIVLVEKILAKKRFGLALDTIAFEAEIDRLVYELYGLTEEEIKIIENHVK